MIELLLLSCEITLNTSEVFSLLEGETELVLEGREVPSHDGVWLSVE